MTEQEGRYRIVGNHPDEPCGVYDLTQPDEPCVKTCANFDEADAWIEAQSAPIPGRDIGE